MADRHPLQSSFAFGEMTPRLLGRSDTDRYRQSLRICENVLTYSHGNAIKRPGTRYLAQSPTENNIRLFDLQSDLSQPYMVEIGHRDATGAYIRLLDREGYVLGSPQYITNPGFSDSLTGWADVSSGDSSVEWVPPGYASFKPTITPDEDAILQQNFSIVSTGQLHNLDLRLFTDAGLDALLVELGTSAGASDILSQSISAGETNITFTPGVTSLWLTITADAALVGASILLDVVICRLASATIWEEAAPWGNDDIPLLSVSESTQQVALYFVVGSTPPWRLIINSPSVFTFEQVPTVSTPAAWQVGNYPRAVTFFQQRLWFAGTPAQPDTLWGSVTNDFLNFALGTGLATDAIEFEMSDRGVITWIQGAKNLLVGADVAEYILTSDAGVVQPGDIQIVQQSSYGGVRQEPAEYANGVLFVGNDQRRIRFMQYQFLEDGWTSKDITWPSEHLTKPLIKEMHFQYAPDPIIWIALENGDCISAVYETEQNDLVGWHRHPFPEGTVLSTSLTKLDAGTEAWVAIKRIVNNIDVVYIERTEVTSGASRSEAGVPTFLMDCGLARTVEAGAGSDLVVNGLEPLEGFTVQVLINGAAHIDRVVVGGSITLQAGFGVAGQVALVGLQYISRMQSLPLEGLNPAGGSSQSVMKRRNRIFVRVLESTIPIINGVTTPARFPSTPMGDGQPLFTGDIQVADLGRDRFAQVTIEMPQAKPYNILALLGDADSDSL